MQQLEERLDMTRRELNACMDKLSERMDKQVEKVDRLASKIDELRRDLRGGSNHGQISTITTISINLAVI